MPNHPHDSTESHGPRPGSRPHRGGRAAVERGPDLSHWLRTRVLRLAEEWHAEIGVRGRGPATAVDDVVARQVLQLSSMMPDLLGPHAAHLQDVWARACELFGTVAARRGLAAGEVIEEFQILRSLVIRDLYQDPLVGGAPSMREALRLNGVLDRGVTYASVGHTDAMFFQLIEDAGAPSLPAEQIVREADRQLAVIREEFEALVGSPAMGADAVGEGWSASAGDAADA